MKQRRQAATWDAVVWLAVSMHRPRYGWRKKQAEELAPVIGVELKMGLVHLLVKMVKDNRG